MKLYTQHVAIATEFFRKIAGLRQTEAVASNQIQLTKVVVWVARQLKIKLSGGVMQKTKETHTK